MRMIISKNWILGLVMRRVEIWLLVTIVILIVLYIVLSVINTNNNATLILTRAEKGFIITSSKDESKYLEFTTKNSDTVELELLDYIYEEMK